MEGYEENFSQEDISIQNQVKVNTFEKQFPSFKGSYSGISQIFKGYLQNQQKLIDKSRLHQEEWVKDFRVTRQYLLLTSRPLFSDMVDEKMEQKFLDFKVRPNQKERIDVHYSFLISKQKAIILAKKIERLDQTEFKESPFPNM